MRHKEIEMEIIQRIADGDPNTPTRSTTIRLPIDAHKQAKLMAVDAGLPLTRIYQLALDDFFEKHGRLRLAAK